MMVKTTKQICFRGVGQPPTGNWKKSRHLKEDKSLFWPWAGSTTSLATRLFLWCATGAIVFWVGFDCLGISWKKNH